MLITKQFLTQRIRPIYLMNSFLKSFPNHVTQFIHLQNLIKILKHLITLQFLKMVYLTYLKISILIKHQALITFQELFLKFVLLNYVKCSLSSFSVLLTRAKFLTTGRELISFHFLRRAINVMLKIIAQSL